MCVCACVHAYVHACVCHQVSAWSQYVFIQCLKMQSMRNEEKKWQNFAHLYLGIGWYNLLQIWYVIRKHLSSKNLDKKSQVWKSCFSIHSSARHTTMCLDLLKHTSLSHMCTSIEYKVLWEFILPLQLFTVYVYITVHQLYFTFFRKFD